MSTFSDFGGSTTADAVVEGLDLSGRVVIVTGANTGIGFETARSLAAAGAHVVLGCRDVEKGAHAVERIRQAHPDARAESRPLDLGSLASVRAFVDKLELSEVHILILNAGLSNGQYTETADGFEETVGVCHIGHFLLTQLLLPKLLGTGGARVVVVSSESHRSPRTLDFERLPLARDQFSPTTSYGQAKLCNVLFANDLQRRYGAQGLTACSLHPGTLITTEIGRGWIVARIAIALARPFSKSPSQGAATTVLCAVHPDPEAIAGLYFSNCQPRESSAESRDPEVARRLWELSEKWVARA